MSAFLYAWELGANLGHLGNFLPVGRRLAAAGHEITLALRETRAAAVLLPDGEMPCVQAPFLRERRESGPPLSYPDILLRFGFDDPPTLLGHVRSWLTLFDRLTTDVVVADHAPAVLVAARVAGLPAMLFGNGFLYPPRTRPMRALRPWETPAPGQLEALDAGATDSINQVLRRLGATPLASVADLFEVAEGSLLGFPEFDHFPDRGPAAYWGHVGGAVRGEMPVWPAVGTRRIFAYLRPSMKHFHATLQVLADCRQSVLAYCPGIDAALAARLSALPQFHLSEQPVDIDLAAQEADIAVTYGSYSTSLAFLQCGKPLLLIPGQLEQFLFARRIEAAGMALVILPEQTAGNLRETLGTLLANPAFALRAGRFAERYRAFTQDTVVGNISRRLIALAGAGAPENALSFAGDA